MLRKSDGFILHSLRYGETSLILRVFTRERGRVSLMVKGVRKAGSRLSALLQPFTELEWVWYEKPGRDMHLVKDVGLIRQYDGISNRYDRYLAASGCLEQYDRFYPEGEEHSGLYERLVQALEHVGLAEQSPWNHFFALWLFHLDQLGITLHTDRCVECGRDIVEGEISGSARVSLEQGAVFCPACEGRGRRVNVPVAILHAINWLRPKSGADLTGRAISRNTAERLYELLEEYSRYHLEWFRGLTVGKSMFKQSE